MDPIPRSIPKASGLSLLGDVPFGEFPFWIVGGVMVAVFLLVIGSSRIIARSRSHIRESRRLPWESTGNWWGCSLPPGSEFVC